jgi:hypothetical protein
LPRPPRLTQQASGECAPSGQGYALLSRVLSPNGHSQLCQVLSTQQLSETIQGPSPGAAQPRGTKGAADIGTGCSACRCQHQPNQQAAWHRSPAVPKLPVLLALLHRGSARLAPAGRPSVRSQLLLPGLPQHVRWAVLKTRPPGKGGASGAPPGPPPPASAPPLFPKPPTLPPTLSGVAPVPSFSPNIPAPPGDVEGTQQNASDMSSGAGGTGKLIRYFFQSKTAAFFNWGRRGDD